MDTSTSKNNKLITPTRKERSGRRSSILKPPKPRTPLVDLDFTAPATEDTQLINRQSRRVSFASNNFVKEFATDNDKNTIWDSTYEEAVDKSNPSTQDEDAPCNSITTNDCEIMEKSQFLDDTDSCSMEFTLLDEDSNIKKSPLISNNIININNLNTFEKTKNNENVLSNQENTDKMNMDMSIKNLNSTKLIKDGPPNVCSNFESEDMCLTGVVPNQITNILNLNKENSFGGHQLQLSNLEDMSFTKIISKKTIQYNEQDLLACIQNQSISDQHLNCTDKNKTNLAMDVDMNDMCMTGMIANPIIVHLNKEKTNGLEKSLPEITTTNNLSYNENMSFTKVLPSEEIQYAVRFGQSSQNVPSIINHAIPIKNLYTNESENLNEKMISLDQSLNVNKQPIHEIENMIAKNILNEHASNHENIPYNNISSIIKSAIPNKEMCNLDVSRNVVNNGVTLNDTITQNIISNQCQVLQENMSLTKSTPTEEVNCAFDLLENKGSIPFSIITKAVPHNVSQQVYKFTDDLIEGNLSTVNCNESIQENMSFTKAISIKPIQCSNEFSNNSKNISSSIITKPSQDSREYFNKNIIVKQSINSADEFEKNEDSLFVEAVPQQIFENINSCSKNKGFTSSPTKHISTPNKEEQKTGGCENKIDICLAPKETDLNSKEFKNTLSNKTTDMIHISNSLSKNDKSTLVSVNKICPNIIFEQGKSFTNLNNDNLSNKIENISIDKIKLIENNENANPNCNGIALTSLINNSTRIKEQHINKTGSKSITKTGVINLDDFDDNIHKNKKNIDTEEIDDNSKNRTSSNKNETKSIIILDQTTLNESKTTVIGNEKEFFDKDNTDTHKTISSSVFIEDNLNLLATETLKTKEKQYSFFNRTSEPSEIEIEEIVFDTTINDENKLFHNREEKTNIKINNTNDGSVYTLENLETNEQNKIVENLDENYIAESLNDNNWKEKSFMSSMMVKLTEENLALHNGLSNLPETIHDNHFTDNESDEILCSTKIITIEKPKTNLSSIKTPSSSFCLNSSNYSAICVDDTQKLINYQIGEKQPESEFSRIINQSNIDADIGKDASLNCNKSPLIFKTKHSLNKSENFPQSTELMFVQYEDKNKVNNTIVKTKIINCHEEIRAFHKRPIPKDYLDVTNRNFKILHKDPSVLNNEDDSEEEIKCIINECKMKQLKPTILNFNNFNKEIENEEKKNKLSEIEQNIRNKIKLQNKDIAQILKKSTLIYDNCSIEKSLKLNIDGDTDDSIDNERSEITFNNNFQHIEKHKVLSLKEKIMKQHERNLNSWEIIDITNNDHKFKIGKGTIILIVKLKNCENGLVEKFEINEVTKDNSDIYYLYEQHKFKKYLDVTVVNRRCGVSCNIQTLLDYIEICYRDIKLFLTNLTYYGAKYSMTMNDNFNVSFAIINFKLMFCWKINIDLTDDENINEDNVTITVEVGTMTDNQRKTLKDFANECNKGVKFLNNYISKVESFLVSLECKKTKNVK